jgi:hypothetical protein
MNLKVANLIAVQFGIFIGIMSWLAYSQLPFGEPRRAAEVQEPMVGPVTTFAPASNPGDQRFQTVDYRADQERSQPVAEQPAPAVQHEYSAAAVQQYSALAAQQYYQQIAPRRYASSGLENASVAADSPSYAVAQQPAAVSSDYAESPQTVAYIQPTQVVVYPQPQFIVFSNQRRFANRCRSTHPPGALNTITHRRPDRVGPHLGGNGIVPRRNPNTPSCRPAQGLGLRGNR